MTPQFSTAIDIIGRVNNINNILSPIMDNIQLRCGVNSSYDADKENKADGHDVPCSQFGLSNG